MIFVDPKSLMEQVKAEMVRIPVDQIDGPHKALQDRWCSAVFGIGYSRYVRQCGVAMNESRNRMDADFFLETAGQVYLFQVTERQAPERRRGDEFKKLGLVLKKIAAEPEKQHEYLLELAKPFRPALGSEQAPSWIEEAIAKKVERYGRSQDLNLVVYANFDALALEAEAIRKKAAIHRDSFASIWIITNHHLCTLFSNDQLGEVRDGGWGHLPPLL